MTSVEIARQILDVARWCEFQGYGVLPGIREARFESLPSGVVGARIAVVNTDGSSHVEEIVEWRPECRLKLRLGEFSAPLSRLATHFEETWQFENVANETRVTRSFALYPRNVFGRVALWGIAFLLRRAIERHIRDLSTPPGRHD